MDISLLKTQIGDTASFLEGIGLLIKHLPAVFKGIATLLTNGDADKLAKFK